MKKRRGILCCLLAASMLVSLTGCSKGGSGTHLLVAHSHNENHPVHVALTHMKDEMEKNAGYTSSICPNGQLGGNSDMIQMMKAGVLDVAKVSASSLEQFNPAYSIFPLPYVLQSTEHYFKVMEESWIVQEIFKSIYDQRFSAVGRYNSGARSVYTTKERPMESPADLKGFKIRIQDSPTSVEMIHNMGGAATPMSSGEAYTSLQQGIIDGAESNKTVLMDDGHEEVAKSYTYTQHQYTSDIVIIFTKTWESMSEQDQEALLRAMDKSFWKHEEKWQEIMERNIQGAKELGVQFYEIDKTSFIQAVKSQHDAFCAESGDNARHLVDFLSYAEQGVRK